MAAYIGKKAWEVLQALAQDLSDAEKTDLQTKITAVNEVYGGGKGVLSKLKALRPGSRGDPVAKNKAAQELVDAVNGLLAKHKQCWDKYTSCIFPVESANNLAYALRNLEDQNSGMMSKVLSHAAGMQRAFQPGVTRGMMLALAVVMMALSFWNPLGMLAGMGLSAAVSMVASGLIALVINNRNKVDDRLQPKGPSGLRAPAKAAANITFSDAAYRRRQSLPAAVASSSASMTSVPSAVGSASRAVSRRSMRSNRSNL